jgi:hypothetical protein
MISVGGITVVSSGSAGTTAGITKAIKSPLDRKHSHRADQFEAVAKIGKRLKIARSQNRFVSLGTISKFHSFLFKEPCRAIGADTVPKHPPVFQAEQSRRIDNQRSG